MFRKIVFYDNFTDAVAGTWTTFLLQGLALILIGLAILIVPQLLAAMVAVTFLMLGTFCLALAFKTKRLRKDYQHWRREHWGQM